MNTLTLVVITVVSTIALCAAIFAVATARKANPQDTLTENFGAAWVKIRPILSELFMNLFNIYNADKGGYDELETFAVNYVKEAIDNADFLTQDEKDMLSKDFLKTILAPQLKDLYNKKVNLL
jgi:hypothetical protein